MKSTNNPDPYANGQCNRTAESFQKLAALRNVSSRIEWNGVEYVANGEPCGASVHGLYDWLNRQPGVLP